MEDFTFFVGLLDWCSRRKQQEKNTLFITIYQVSQINLTFPPHFDILGSKKKDNFEAGVICAEVNMVNIFFIKIYFNNKALET